MNTSPLTPGLSTHFRWRGPSVLNLTKGKIYKILEWKNDGYCFLDDSGEEDEWWCQDVVEDASYIINLKTILE